MFSRSYHVATIHRGIALACSAVLSGCALRGTDHPVVSPAPADEIVREGYVVETAAFALVTSSAPSKAIALTSLHGTATAFQWLFGGPAPHIGVVVVDRNEMPPAATTMIPEDLTTIMVMHEEPDPADPAKSATDLASALRTMSSDAMLHDYAKFWAAALHSDDADHATPPEDAARTEALPHWLRVGALRVIAEGSMKPTMLVPPRALPLRDLFGYELRPDQVALVGRMLHHPATLALDDGNASPDETAARSFILQSASVLRFLRESEGSDATADFFGASMSGMPAEEILAQLGHPATIDAFERAWQHWADAKGRVVAMTVQP